MYYNFIIYLFYQMWIVNLIESIYHTVMKIVERETPCIAIPGKYGESALNEF